MSHQHDLELSTDKNNMHFLSAVLASLVIHGIVLISLPQNVVPVSRVTKNETKSLNLEIKALVNIAKPKTKAQTKRISKAIKPQSSSELVQNQSTTSRNANNAHESIMASYLEQVRAVVEKAKFYPEKAKRMRQQGVVEVTFKVAASGQLLEIVSVMGPFQILNDASKEILSLKTKYPAFPSEMEMSDLTITLPISFELM